MPAERLSKTGSMIKQIIYNIKLKVKVKVKVKVTHYVPGEALRAQEFEVPRIFRQSSHEGGKVVSPTHWPPFTPRKYSW